MNVNNVSLTISAVRPEQYPNDGLYEIAFVGRSNVGKSSLINKLVNRKKLARISSKPGKTATINFYNIEDKFYFVDLPGYGYAKVSKKEKEKWGVMINTYLHNRKNLKGIVQLIDSRHEPSENDVTMVNWLRSYNYPLIVAATKSDKLKNKEKIKNYEIIKDTLNISNEDKLILFSAQTGEGKEELWEALENILLKGEIDNEK